jgi:hypothetical protein
MNRTVRSHPSENKSSKSAGGKKGVTFLGLKTNTTQFVDTSISNIEDKPLESILLTFHEQLSIDAEKKPKYQVGTTFNEHCTEGYQFLVNVLICDAKESGRDPDRLSKMKLTTL